MPLIRTTVNDTLIEFVGASVSIPIPAGETFVLGGAEAFFLADARTVGRVSELDAKAVGTTGPGSHGVPGMAYDSERGVTVLFGGADDTTTFGETWEWHRADWA